MYTASFMLCLFFVSSMQLTFVPTLSPFDSPLFLTFVSHEFPGEFGEGESEGLGSMRSGENEESAAGGDEEEEEE